MLHGLFRISRERWLVIVLRKIALGRADAFHGVKMRKRPDERTF